MKNLNQEKCLIAYFSREGNNYVSGKIVNLPIGNTEVIAKMIQEITKGDLFRIDTINSYPEDYTETTEVAQKELDENARPELNNRVQDIDSYNVILLGYPIWWRTMPMPILTFIEEYDFSGKTIIPFCTHEGSGLGQSEQDLSKICTEATLLKGLAIHGSQVQTAKKDIRNWLNEIGIIL
jgi:flavodoxin